MGGGGGWMGERNYRQLSINTHCLRYQLFCDGGKYSILVTAWMGARCIHTNVYQKLGKLGNCVF